MSPAGRSPRFLALSREFSGHNNAYIPGSTFPVRLEDEGYRNRAYRFGPDDSVTSGTDGYTAL